MLKNLFYFTSGATSAFIASYYFLQQDIYSTSAVFVEKLDKVHTQIANIAAESRMMESKSQAISRELDMLTQSKHNEMEDLKKTLLGTLKEQGERQERINEWMLEHIHRLDTRTVDLVSVLAEDDAKLGEKLTKLAEQREDEEH